MTTKIDDGGPAFPAEYFSPEVFAQLRETEGVHSAKAQATGVSRGMSRRDWLAGQAIGAVIRQCASDFRYGDGTLPEYFAAKAYEIADAMIAAGKAGAE